MPRNYVPNGKPNGGKRPGAGRKPGSRNTLPLGAVAAVRSAGLRVPDSATEAQRQLADRALVRVADVLEEGVSSFQAGHVLKAATILREEVCGPAKQKVEHSFSDMTDEQLEAKYQAAKAKVDAALAASSEAEE